MKRATGKLLGTVDIAGRTIYVRPDTPLDSPIILHEAGHAWLPWQRDTYLIFQEDRTKFFNDGTDEFEREANQFAWELLFQLDGFRSDAEHGEFSLRTPINLSPRYGCPQYAAIRRFVETNRRQCAVIVMERCHSPSGTSWGPHRISQSPSFTRHFGEAAWERDFEPMSAGILPPGQQYGPRYTRRIRSLDRGPVECECQDCCLMNFMYIFVYPLKELLSVPIPYDRRHAAIDSKN